MIRGVQTREFINMSSALLLAQDRICHRPNHQTMKIRSSRGEIFLLSYKGVKGPQVVESEKNDKSYIMYSRGTWKGSCLRLDLMGRRCSTKQIQ